MTEIYERSGYIPDLVRAKQGDRAAQERLAEYRAATTTSLGGFTTPEYAADKFAIRNSKAASFTKMTTKLEDPGYGMQLNIPTLTSAGVAVTQATENTSVLVASEPAGGLQTSNIATVAAALEVSEQLLDRMDPAAEQVFNETLASSLLQQVENVVLTSVLAGANAVTGASTPFGSAQFKLDVGNAFTQANDATQLSPTVLFTSGDLAQFLLSYVDANGQPLFLSFPGMQYSEDQIGPTGQEPTGCTGMRQGMLEVMFSNEMPAETLLVATPADVYTLVTEPQIDVVYGINDTATSLGGQTLTALVRAYCYVGVIAREPTAQSKITGSAYVPVWTAAGTE